MSMHRGDIYACSNPDCGAQISVTRGVNAEGGGDFSPRCSCGATMERQIVTSERV